MRNKQDHIDGLSGMKRCIYFDGRLIDRTDELQKHCLNTIGLTFDEAQKPENANPMTAVSHLTGECINLLTHIHQTTNDLHKKPDMTRILCRKAGGCIRRCVGIDLTNAICKHFLQSWLWSLNFPFDILQCRVLSFGGGRLA